MGWNLENSDKKILYIKGTRLVSELTFLTLFKCWKCQKCQNGHFPKKNPIYPILHLSGKLFYFFYLKIITNANSSPEIKRFQMAVLKWQRKNKHFSVFATKSMVKNVRSDTSDTIRSVRPFISDMRQCQTFHFGVYLAVQV